MSEIAELNLNYKASHTGAKFHRSKAMFRGLKGPIGCLSADHEFLSRDGWKRIDQWAGDEILVVDPAAGISRFEVPTYVKLPCESFLHFKSRGIDQVVSDEHRVLHFKKFNRDVMRVSSAADIAEAHNGLKEGWDGLIPCAFPAPDNADGVQLSDEELRVMVMVCADGHFHKASSGTKWCGVTVRKERKKTRIRALLASAGIAWKEYCHISRPTEIRFAFNAPERNKLLSKYWRANAHQLALIADEVVHWDGMADAGYGDWRYTTTSKADADFVEYVFSAAGRRTSVSVQAAKGNWADCYSVCAGRRGYAGLRYGDDKNEIKRVPSEDGLKYCFTTSTGFFVTRRNDCIAVTGNSGKSVTCCWELFRLAMLQEPWTDKIRRSRWLVVRGTYPELKSTTIKTWQDWFPPSICPFKFDAPITGRMRLPLEDGTTLDMEIVFLSLENEGDVKKVLSAEYTGVWFNEARELPWSIVEAALGRIGRYPRNDLGGHTRKAAIADTNPSDDDHWWYKLAEEGRLNENSEPITEASHEFFSQPGALIKTEAGYIPNPHAENIENLKDGYRYYLDQIPGRAPEWIKVYILGQYGTVQDGKPVYGDSYSDELHSSKVAFEPVRRWPVVLSFDFGLTPAAVFKQMTPIGQNRAIQEVIGESIGLKQFVENAVLPLLNTRYKDCTIHVTGDPAGTSRSQNDEKTAYEVLEELLGKKVASITPAPSNFIDVRISAVRTFLGRLLGAGKACYQVSPECKMLRKGFMGRYKFKKIQVAGSLERYQETPEKNMFSHVHDANQYADMLILAGLPDAINIRAGSKVVVASEVGY